MKNLRKVALACTFVFVVMAVVGSVYGIGDPGTGIGGGNQIGEITGLSQDIWATLTVIFQILAVAAVVVAGVRYMFASADQKADIKKQTVILIVGAVLVFSATTILKFVSGVANNAFKITE